MMERKLGGFQFLHAVGGGRGAGAIYKKNLLAQRGKVRQAGGTRMFVLPAKVTVCPRQPLICSDLSFKGKIAQRHVPGFCSVV